MDQRFEELFQLGDAEGHRVEGIGHFFGAAEIFFLAHIPKAGAGGDDFRLPVWQNRQNRPERRLKDPAVNGFE